MVKELPDFPESPSTAETGAAQTGTAETGPAVTAAAEMNPNEFAGWYEHYQEVAADRMRRMGPVAFPGAMPINPACPKPPSAVQQTEPPRQPDIAAQPVGRGASRGETDAPCLGLTFVQIVRGASTTHPGGVRLQSHG
jgi:hypothetical protein